MGICKKANRVADVSASLNQSLANGSKCRKNKFLHQIGK